MRTFGTVDTPAAPAPAAGTYPEAAALVIDATLTANQPIGAGVNTDPAAQFQLESMGGTKTGSYKFRLQLPNGKMYPATQAQDVNIIGTGLFPIPIDPPPLYPPGTRINAELSDTSGAGNTVQILLRGRYIFPVR